VLGSWTKTSRNFAILFIICAVALGTVSPFLINQYKKSAIELRKAEIKRLVSFGLNSIETYRQKYESGTISKSEALKYITDEIRGFTYRDHAQENYLFMSSYDGTMLVQPYQPEMEGSNQIDLVDSDGVYIIRELIKQAKRGAGFISYRYPPPNSDEPQVKISYVVGLPELECYIGTGIYINDIEAIILQHSRQMIFFLLAVFIIVLGTTLYILIPIVRAVHYITLKFEEAGRAGRHFSDRIKRPEIKGKSDAGMMVHRFDEMTRALSEQKDNLIKAVQERDALREEHIGIIEKSLDQKDILLKEINHRIKNNLQIIISLLKMHKEKSDDEKVQKTFLESISRIESISIIHNMLYSREKYSSISGDKYLEELISYIIHSFRADEQIKISFDMEEADFDLDQAVSIGIITNEIITNAVKYAFPNGEKGNIKIKLSQESGKYTLMICDDGAGIPDKYLKGKKDSLGINLIYSLSAQLNAELTIKNKKGTEYTIVFG
jgi:two-component sensor histidine kinase